jgi:hypothetical protein
MTSIFPSWLLVIMSGIITQSMLRFMHRNDGKKELPKKSLEGEKKTGAVSGPTVVVEKKSVEATPVQKKVPVKASKGKKGK